MTIHERLRFLRKTLKLPQAVFARDISVSSGYVVSLELGNRRMNPRIIRLVCSTYNVNRRWLETGEGEMFLKPLGDKLEKMTGIFKQLEPVFQDFLLNQMDNLLRLQNQQDGVADESDVKKKRG